MTKDGGPAFPRPYSWDESPVRGLHPGDRPFGHEEQGGMSLRDYFAAAALAHINLEAMRLTSVEGRWLGSAAAEAYAVADAMIAEREKP